MNVSSNSINFVLLVGEDKKISLTYGFYNLYVKLNQIVDGKANLTMKIINEPILVQEPVVEDKNLTEENTSSLNADISPIEGGISTSFYICAIALVILAIVITVLVVLIFRTDKNTIVPQKRKLNKKGQFEGEFE